ncbi:MAG: hypothetical protein DCF15_06335 [Phormidesmis priestleyi]|uniref:Uncharacterized protein n=1 Tax=Phormidesmis priestleyi TaxID=268141 RepID=A0A2W4XLM1_9CYAN|nr:MAG: hypothetical protein DCF15_06335 [Phormidesmis priestleyi]
MRQIRFQSIDQTFLPYRLRRYEKKARLIFWLVLTTFLTSVIPSACNFLQYVIDTGTYPTQRSAAFFFASQPELLWIGVSLVVVDLVVVALDESRIRWLKGVVVIACTAYLLSVMLINAGMRANPIAESATTEAIFMVANTILIFYYLGVGLSCVCIVTKRG